MASSGGNRYHRTLCSVAFFVIFGFFIFMFYSNQDSVSLSNVGNVEKTLLEIPIDGRCSHGGNKDAKDTDKQTREQFVKNKNVEFTVCSSILRTNFRNVSQLVEKIEMSRILGAGRVVFYNSSVSNKVDAVLRWYAGEWAAGTETLEVVVLPWHLPVSLRPEDVYSYGEVAALNDCLNRYRRSSTYIVFTGLGQHIVPRRSKDWSTLISQAKKTKPGLSGFLFQSKIFRQQWLRPAETFKAVAQEYKSAILGHTQSENCIISAKGRSRMIVDPKVTEEMGVNAALRISGAIYNVVVEDGLLHDYREALPKEQLTEEERKKCSTPVTDTHVVDAFGEQLAVRLKKIWPKLGDKMQKDAVSANASDAIQKQESLIKPGPVDTKDKPIKPGTADKKDQPIKPGTADKKDQPIKPGTADKKDQPIKPGTADKKDKPIKPGTADKKDQPIKPGTAGKKDQPIKPETADKKDQPIKPGTADKKDQSIKPGPIDTSHQFHLVEGGPSLLLVYSAIWEKDVVRIIAIKERSKSLTGLRCVFYSSADQSSPSFTTVANVMEIPEHHGTKHTAACVKCPIQKGSLPAASVGLVYGNVAASSKPKVVLPIENVRGSKIDASKIKGAAAIGGGKDSIVTDYPEEEQKVEFSLCVPAFYNYGNAAQLVEKIEMSRLQGVGRIVLFNNSISSNVDAVLRWYAQERAAGRDKLEVKVYPWHLPQVYQNGKQGSLQIHYFGQMAAIDYCLHRYRYLSRYIMFTDMDEFFIPLRHDNLSQLVAERQKLHPHSKGLLFQSTVFNKERPSPAKGFEADAVQFGSAVLGLTSRDKYFFPPNHRSKVIVDPTKANVMGIHFIWKGSGLTDNIPKDQGILAHFRSQLFACKPQVVDTRVSDKYGKQLVLRLKEVWSKLKGVPLGWAPVKNVNKRVC